MIIQIVRHRSGLSDEEVQERFEERAAGYRQVGGLLHPEDVPTAGNRAG